MRRSAEIVATTMSYIEDVRDVFLYGGWDRLLGFFSSVMVIACFLCIIIKFDSLDRRFAAEFKAIHVELASLHEAVADKQSHDYHHERVMRMESASAPMYLCGSRATSHAVRYKGRLANLTVSHFPCNGIQPQGYITCEGVDVAIAKGCPTVSLAIDINAVYKTHPGDQITTYGFGSVSRVFSGTLSSVQRKNVTGSQWNFDGPKNDPEYLYQGDIEEGQSGAAVYNGCAYAAMQHGILFPSVKANAYCLAIPVATIHKCLDDHINELIPQVHCPHTTVPKALPFSDSGQCKSRLVRERVFVLNL